MAVAAFMDYSDAADEATEKTDAWTEASRTAAKQYGEQKGKIESLLMVAENENISLDRRKKAVAELNRIIPGYNAKIDETTLKYIASKEALDKYLQSLEKEMRYKANEQKMSELLATAEEARDAYDEAIINYNSASNKKRFIWQSSDKDKAREALKEAKQTWDEAESSYKAFKERMEKAMQEGEIIAPSTEDSTITTGLTEPLENANSAASETVTRLKEINAEIKRLRKIDPNSDEELDRIQKRIKLLQDEKKALMGKTKKSKRERGTYEEDSLNDVSAPIDDRHQRTVLDINKQDLPETEKTIAKNKELIRYCAELSTA
ncbi:MAG: hypothetical protein K2H85_07395, partial [Allobaculum sp.]|nr:hypothetical protein [Allobaculum sp.]